MRMHTDAYAVSLRRCDLHTIHISWHVKHVMLCHVMSCSVMTLPNMPCYVMFCRDTAHHLHNLYPCHDTAHYFQCYDSHTMNDDRQYHSMEDPVVIHVPN